MDLITGAKMVFALLFTLALIAGAAWAARRFGMIQVRPGGARRMRVVESLMLDPRRRLVIVRCDAREHVLLLSPAGDVALASGEAAAPLQEGAP
ncbi:MAG: flagellar biosynthetic protein FliO [Hyphomonadaceae bacterium]